MFKSDAPPCHICNGTPAFQWTRLADKQERALQCLDFVRLQGRRLSNEEISAKYGPLRVAVTGCSAHHLGEDSENADSGLERRTLLHDADCVGHGGCRCGGACA